MPAAGRRYWIDENPRAVQQLSRRDRETGSG
jgi:hypothetical protein